MTIFVITTNVIVWILAWQILGLKDRYDELERRVKSLENKR